MGEVLWLSCHVILPVMDKGSGQLNCHDSLMLIVADDAREAESGDLMKELATF